MKNAGIFIDVSNLYYCTKRKFDGAKIDFTKYMDLALENIPPQDVIVRKAYGTKMNNEADTFIKFLNNIGLTTKFIKTPQRKYTSLNVNISVDVFRQYKQLNTVVLGNSSREIIPLVKFLEEQGIRVVIIACGICTELTNIASAAIEISDDCLEKGNSDEISGQQESDSTQVETVSNA